MIGEGVGYVGVWPADPAFFINAGSFQIALFANAKLFIVAVSFKSAVFQVRCWRQRALLKFRRFRAFAGCLLLASPAGFSSFHN